MPYQINLFNGQPLVVVDDGTINQDKTTLKMVGKNYAGYGETQNENFVFLTENFANSNPPANQLNGQLWYDNFNRKLKFWDETKQIWRSTGGAEIGPTPPGGLTTGDFWWNTRTKQLFSFDGVDKFILIGPQAVEGAGDTLMLSVSVIDTEGNRHAIIKALVDGKCIFIISRDTFTLDSNINPITGFSFIKQGTTLVDTSTTGITSTAYRWWGMASDTERLGGLLASEYVHRVLAQFENVASFDDRGLSVGVDGDLLITIQGGTTPVIENVQNNIIRFRVKDGVTNPYTLNVEGITVVPGITDSYDLGTLAKRWRKVYAKEFYGDLFQGGTFVGDFQGTALKADTLLYARASTSDKYRSATDEVIPNSIVARDASGSFSANEVIATATRARYADLAERYESDAVYEPGTVLVFGGEKEVTVTTELGDYRVAGVVSTSPAYIMNDSDETKHFPPVALRGKVPIKVIGRVQKGDILITSAVAGYAVSAQGGHNIPASSIVAKAIEEKITDESGVVMAVIV